jgi:hypothetical protein
MRLHLILWQKVLLHPGRRTYPQPILFMLSLLTGVDTGNSHCPSVGRVFPTNICSLHRRELAAHMPHALAGTAIPTLVSLSVRSLPPQMTLVIPPGAGGDVIVSVHGKDRHT